MRVEPTPYVFRNEDRRQRFDDRRASSAEHAAERHAEQPRAVHEAPKWFAAPFGAHILGQIAPVAIEPGIARRAYMQPEARTPLRPSSNTRA